MQVVAPNILYLATTLRCFCQGVGQGSSKCEVKVTSSLSSSFSTLCVLSTAQLCLNIGPSLRSDDCIDSVPHSPFSATIQPSLTNITTAITQTQQHWRRETRLPRTIAGGEAGIVRLRVQFDTVRQGDCADEAGKDGRQARDGACEVVHDSKD